MQERYPEKRLHLKAVAWLREQRGYDERFSDEEAVGHRMDSVGLLDGRMTLIEVKTTATAPLVTSIEHKIAGALGSIYRGETGDLAERAQSLWDRTTPPLIAILAGSYSEPALTGLHLLLETRSHDWLFGYEIMRWDGEKVITVAQGGLHTPVPSETFTRVDVPRLSVKGNRPRARSLGELVEIADQRGVGELFRRFIENTRARSYTLGTGRWTANAKTRLPGYENGQFLGAYLNASGDGRLNVGLWAEVLDLDSRELPGVPAAKAAGFLNTNRELTTIEEVDALFEIPLIDSSPS